MAKNKLIADFQGALGEGRRCIVILQPGHPDHDIHHLKALRDVLAGQGRVIRYIVDDVTGFSDRDEAYDATTAWLDGNDMEVREFLGEFQKLGGLLAMAPIHEYSKQTLKSLCKNNPAIQAVVTRMATEKAADQSHLDDVRTARDGVMEQLATLMTVRSICASAEVAPVVCDWIDRNDYHALIEKNNGELGQYLPVVATAAYCEDRSQPEPEAEVPKTAQVLTLRPKKG